MHELPLPSAAAAPHDVVLGPLPAAVDATARARLQLQEGRIVAAQVDIGFAHRGWEACAEAVQWRRLLPFTARLAPQSPHTSSLAYVGATERLLGIVAPRRARYLRVLVAELARMCGHLVALAAVCDRSDHPRAAAAWRGARATVAQALRDCFGGVETPAYGCFGGVAHDLSAAAARHLRGQLRQVDRLLGRADWTMRRGCGLRRRLSGRGRLTAAQAVAFGLTGPLLRACGVAYDVRQAHPYDAYDELRVTPTTASGGDCAARWQVRRAELGQSRALVDQVLAGLPEGPWAGEGAAAALPWPAAVPVAAPVAAPVGAAEQELYSATECANGELGFFLVREGAVNAPATDLTDLHAERLRRCRVRAPSFWAMQAYEQLLLPGAHVTDAALLYACANVFADACDR